MFSLVYLYGRNMSVLLCIDISSKEHWQGRIQDFEMGVNFCHNFREIKYYFNILGTRKKKERRGLRKRGVKIHPSDLP